MGATCIATSLEERPSLPVDAVIPDPIFTSTHAITIDAPPDKVWPWIAQMGSGRAGWHSWDAIDNGGAPSSTRIMPAFQTVARGDILPAIPGAKDAFVVAAVDPRRDLVLTVPDGHGGNAVGWEHVLDPLDGGRTRLIVRGRASSHWLDFARTKPPACHRRIFIERAYAALARLPWPLLIALVESNQAIWEEISGALAKGKVEAAAAALRRHLEYVSRHLADQLGATPQLRADGNYELGELLPSVLSRMKDLYGKAAPATPLRLLRRQIRDRYRPNTTQNRPSSVTRGQGQSTTSTT